MAKYTQHFVKMGLAFLINVVHNKCDLKGTNSLQFNSVVSLPF